MSPQGTRPALAAAVAQLVTARTGLTFPRHRLAIVASGLERAMGKTGIADAGDYLARLADDGPAFAALIDEVTVGETFFFRDAASFEFIRHTVLPDLLERHGAAAWFSAWSAGCASGEEAYSLAILFEEEGVGRRGCVFATDLSEAALAKARVGIYGRWSLRGWPGPPLAQYFDRTGNRYRVADRLRARIAFAPLNLAADPYPGERPDAAVMDLILCRNVLIYLNRARIGEVARHLFAALADGGWLITGPSDPSLAAHAPFEVVTNAAGLIYRRPARRTAIPAAPSPHAPIVLPVPIALPVSPCPPDAPPASAVLSAVAQLGDARALQALGHHAEAVQAARRAIFLDRGFAVAHLVLGSILWQRGNRRGAKRAYRTGHILAAALPPDQPMTGTEGECAAGIAAAAAAMLALIERRSGAA